MNLLTPIPFWYSIIFIGCYLYAAAQGIREGLVWEKVQKEIEHFEYKYHFWRTVEIIGTILMLIGASIYHTFGYSWYMISFQMLSLLILMFFIYRLAFVLTRKTDIYQTLIPNWKYTLWLPYFGNLDISYPLRGRPKLFILIAIVTKLLLIFIFL